MLFTRPDGTQCTGLDVERRIMPFIMRTRTESQVFFEQQIDLSRTLPFIEQFNAAHPGKKIGFFHVFLWAAVQALHQRPRMNRFVMGSKLWARNGIYISYSAKKKLDDDSPTFVVKRKFEPGLGFEQLIDFIYADLKEGRGDKERDTEKEMRMFLKLPAPVLRFAVKLLFWLDSWNLLPAGFIMPDPMYASLFIANLGSVRLDSAYHHLYEYGTIGLFAVIGRVQELTRAGGTYRGVSVKYTFDERCEDGLYAMGALAVLKELCEDPAQGLTRAAAPAITAGAPA